MSLQEDSAAQFNALLDKGSTKPTKAILVDATRRSYPIFSLAVGTVLAASASYLAFYGTYDTYRQASQISISDGIGNLGNAAEDSFYLGQYDAWSHDTASIRHGNGTDINIPALESWCAKCFNSAKVDNAIGSSGFHFEHCPGIAIQDVFTANPGDFDYPDMCSKWYEFIDGYFAGLVGIKNDYNTDDEVVTPYVLNVPPASDAFAAIGGVIRAIAISALTIKTVKEFTKRTVNSFSSQPDEILTGKRNKWMNAALMPAAFIESLIRATPSGMAAWLSVQGTQINQGLAMTLVGAETMAATFSYFPDFDTIYTRIPHDAQKLGYSTVSMMRKWMGYTSEHKESANILYNELIYKINTLMDGIQTVKPEVVDELYGLIAWNKHKRKAIT